jgi:hypothetical protein
MLTPPLTRTRTPPPRARTFERDYRRTRRTNFDSTAVAEAWRRTRELLDAGLGLADVVDKLESREQAEAIRQNARTHFTAAMNGARGEQVERAVREVIDAVDGAEIPLMTDPIDQHAAEREMERRAGGRAVEAMSRFVRERRAGIPADAAAMLSLGHALAAEGFVPAAPAPDEQDVAERQRNSLPPELRAALEANALDAGSQSPIAPAETPSSDLRRWG